MQYTGMVVGEGLKRTYVVRKRPVYVVRKNLVLRRPPLADPGGRTRRPPP